MHTDENPILELRNIDTYYGPIQVLREVNISIRSGEITCLLGGNASGKSTTLRTVLGMVTPSRGSIHFRGNHIEGISTTELVQRGVSMVPENRRIFGRMTVLENLEMGAYIRKDDIRPRQLEIYEMFPPLAEKKKQAAGELSGGQRQMVAMGKALMLEPTLLMLDEPTAGLSPIYRNEIFQIVRQINDSGVPILMVEQNAKQSLAVASRGYVLVDGQNRTTGKGTDLLNDPEIAKMFLGG